MYRDCKNDCIALTSSSLRLSTPSVLASYGGQADTLLEVYGNPTLRGTPVLMHCSINFLLQFDKILILSII